VLSLLLFSLAFTLLIRNRIMFFLFGLDVVYLVLLIKYFLFGYYQVFLLLLFFGVISSVICLFFILSVLSNYDNSIMVFCSDSSEPKSWWCRGIKSFICNLLLFCFWLVAVVLPLILTYCIAGWLDLSLAIFALFIIVFLCLFYFFLLLLPLDGDYWFWDFMVFLVLFFSLVLIISFCILILLI